MVEELVDETVHERSVEDVDVLDAGGGDQAVGFASQVEVQVFAGRCFEDVEGEVRGQDAPDPVANCGLRQCHLTVDDHLAATLDRGDHHLDACRRCLERGRLREVALHDRCAPPGQRGEGGALSRVVDRVRSHQQPQLHLSLDPPSIR